MTEPMVSVLLVTYNHERFIERALASIASQALDGDIEVVVADDSSEDQTLAIVQEWAGTVPFDVRVLPRQPRLGITQNYHRGFSACRGRYIAVLEGDDEWISVDKLQLQADLLEKRPDLSMSATRILLYDELTGSSSALPLIGLDSMEIEVTSRQLADSNWFATFSCCMYRAETLERLNPEIFETTAYDWLINMAVTEFGNAGLVAEVATLYRIHQNGKWSQARQRDRDEQIRALLPRYIELIGSNVGRELTRYMHGLDARVAQSVDLPEATAAVSDEHSVALPVPRVTNPRRPRVSVVMPCYNHEPFVVAAINSVLDQTMADFELIVVDDGSSDASMRAVASVSDERLRVYRFAHNQGAAASLNFAIQQTRAEHVALINSDDMWEPHKLERQLEVLERRPEVAAVFTGARFVDEAGNPLPPHRLPRWNTVFRQPSRTQAQWLRFFFENGNALCHPSVLIRRSFYVEHGLYDNRMRQLPDFERWITLVKHHPIAVLGDEDLVRFRLLPSEQNASSASRANVVRGLHEHLAIDEHFFEGVSTDLIVEGFGDLLRDQHVAEADELACELAFLWWDTPCPMQEVNRVHALRLLRELMGNPDTARMMVTRHGFTDLTLHMYAGAHERTMSEPQLEWLQSLDTKRMLPEPEPGSMVVEQAPAGQLVRVVLGRARRAKRSVLPHRVLFHLRRVLSSR
ncbi:glycosyltransferase [Modestobacter sp. VKM Ac-2977]|uniref:glycosyltransferase family 2 protein n=1 Tax=Modestobacter sp. VKM Ac-2977 TaxID=3004131 RepID=UPI0022AA2DC4|nr:glycosyltransferase [Modestobacter sp. VKM Ac-2977]MCZ2822352.1 glycosyltransferase [Modestobacter sp. VKM Ac-2977]